MVLDRIQCSKLGSAELGSRAARSKMCAIGAADRDNWPMAERPLDKDREERLHNEIVVDAYGPEEQAMGWYAYLESTLEFPFLTRCVSGRAISPLPGS